MTVKTELDEVHRNALFRTLTEDEVRYLARGMEERDYKKGDAVFEEEEIPGLLYVVQKGAVEITKKAPSGHRQVIAVVQPGRFFGELSFFGNRRHGARALALEPTRLLLLSRFFYDELERDQPLLVHKLLREIILVMSANLDSMNDMFLQMIHYAFYGGKAGRVDLSEGRGN